MTNINKETKILVVDEKDFPEIYNEEFHKNTELWENGTYGTNPETQKPSNVTVEDLKFCLT